jgi:hypothetical protein
MDSNDYGGDWIYLDNDTGLVDVENNLVYRVSGNAVYTPHGPNAPNEANIVKNNILAYGRQSMMSVNFPYGGGVPAVIPQVFVITNNLFYFDRTNTSSPKFWVQGGCVYSGEPLSRSSRTSTATSSSVSESSEEVASSKTIARVRGLLQAFVYNEDDIGREIRYWRALTPPSQVTPRRSTSSRTPAPERTRPVAATPTITGSTRSQPGSRR